jgi:D-3-phosphoglycerate dehydrogenase
VGRHAPPGRAPVPGLQGLNAISEGRAGRVVLVSRAEDENILLRFRAAFTRAFDESVDKSSGAPAGQACAHHCAYRVGFAHAVPAGPGIVGLAVAPPVRVTAAHVAALPGLRIAAAASTGYDHLDVAALTAAGVSVAHTPGYCDIEVADHAIAMIVALLRNLHAGDALVRQGRWSSRAVGAKRITGSVLGVVGLGRIGALVAGRAVALGMRVLAWAPRTPAAQARELGVTPVATLAELLRASDVVSLHVPLTPGTTNLIDADALAAMRPGAALVNCGRGELVDHGALRAALESGRLAGAALDVLDAEPPPEDHIAFALPRTIITPHLAWLSPESEYASYEMAAAAIAAVLCGRSPQHVVEEKR